MAAGDYNVADRDTTNLEAGDKVNETVFVNPDGEAADFAASAGVRDAAYANYAAALDAHTDRADIESLAARRARDNADTFAAADFMRAAPYTDGAATRPGPGTVDGVADDSGTDDGSGTFTATAPQGYGDGNPATTTTDADGDGAPDATDTAPTDPTVQ